MFEAASASLLGNRKINQDRCSILSNEHSVLLLLADGLGGHPKGEVAAQILMDVGRIAFSSSPKPIPNPQEFLNRILRSAHDAIIAFGQKNQPPISPKATAVLALIQNGQLFWCHVGDSRLYLVRNHRVLMRTRDHSVLEAMHASQGSELDKSAMRYRHLVTHCLGAIGKELITCNNESIILHPFDMVLLCTDGLWGFYSEEALGSRITLKDSVAELVAKLAKEAEQATAPRSDNVTLIALRWINDMVGKSKVTADVLPKNLSASKEAATVLPNKVDLPTDIAVPIEAVAPKELITKPPVKSKHVSATDSDLDEAILTLRAVLDEFSLKDLGN